MFLQIDRRVDFRDKVMLLRVILKEKLKHLQQHLVGLLGIQNPFAINARHGIEVRADNAQELVIIVDKWGI